MHYSARGWLKEANLGYLLLMGPSELGDRGRRSSSSSNRRSPDRSSISTGGRRYCFGCYHLLYSSEGSMLLQRRSGIPHEKNIALAARVFLIILLAAMKPQT